MSPVSGDLVTHILGFYGSPDTHAVELNELRNSIILYSKKVNRVLWWGMTQLQLFNSKEDGESGNVHDPHKYLWGGMYRKYV